MFQSDFNQIDQLAKAIESNPERRKLLLTLVWTKALKSYRNTTLHFTGNIPKHPIEILLDLLNYKTNKHKNTFQINNLYQPDLDY